MLASLPQKAFTLFVNPFYQAKLSKEPRRLKSGKSKREKKKALRRAKAEAAAANATDH